MKKILLLLTSLVYIQTLLAQQWTTSGNNIYNSNSGNIGIGTTTPALKLDINGSAQIYPSANKGATGALKLRFMPGTNASIIEANNDNNWANHDIIINAASATGGNSNQLVVHRSGNVGIGTINPQAKFDVEGNVTLLTGQHKLYISELYSFDPSKAGIRCNAGGMVLNAKDGGVLYLNRDVNADTRIQSTISGNTIDIAVFKSDGTVGIGTASPGPYKLAVEGTIGARKVKVTQANPWADYVFNDNYPLMSLKELDDYIHKNKHLPDMPSASEVEKNGLDLGDNQALLLKKIEELTLYIIDQQKQIDELKKEFKSVKK